MTRQIVNLHPLVCSQSFSLLSHLRNPNWWHSLWAEVSRIANPTMMVVLIINVIVLCCSIITAVIMLIFSRESSLNALIHCGTLQSLLLLILALRVAIVTQLLVHCCLLMVHLTWRAMCLTRHHVSVCSRGTVRMITSSGSWRRVPHIEVILTTDWRVSAVSIWGVGRTARNHTLVWSGRSCAWLLLVEVLDLSEDSKATLRWNEARNYFLGNVFGRSSEKVF